MSMRTTGMSALRRARQRGTAAVEFALVAAVFFTLLIGIAEFARVLYYWNTAAEAARLGARIAVVCDLNDPTITTRMTNLLPLLKQATINVTYTPSGCTASSCNFVTVGYSGLTVQTFIPFVPLSIALPPFSTTLPRESMTSATGGSVC